MRDPSKIDLKKFKVLLESANEKNCIPLSWILPKEYQCIIDRIVDRYKNKLDRNA